MLLALRQETVIISPTRAVTRSACWQGSFGQPQWSGASAPADRPLTNPNGRPTDYRWAVPPGVRQGSTNPDLQPIKGRLPNAQIHDRRYGARAVACICSNRLGGYQHDDASTAIRCRQRQRSGRLEGHWPVRSGRCGRCPDGKALRVSNVLTSGSFGDMPYSKPVTKAAGENEATNVLVNEFTVQAPDTFSSRGLQ